MVISDLNPYRLFLQYWLLIRNHPDAFHDCYWSKRARVVVIDHMTKLLHCSKDVVVTYWLTFASFVVAFRVRIPAWATFHPLFNFSVSHPPKYKNIGFNFQTDK